MAKKTIKQSQRFGRGGNASKSTAGKALKPATGDSGPSSAKAAGGKKAAKQRISWDPAAHPRRKDLGLKGDGGRFG